MDFTIHCRDNKSTRYRVPPECSSHTLILFSKFCFYFFAISVMIFQVSCSSCIFGQNFSRVHVMSSTLPAHRIVLHFIVYDRVGCFDGCETCSLTLREGCRVRVFENRVLRRIFVFKRGEVRGKWRRLHNKDLYALYFSPCIIRRSN